MLLAILLILAQASSAQDSLTAARDLYRGAAYDDALALLNGLHGSQRPEENLAIEQYRALCLLALGRVDEAEHAIEAVVITAPSYHPSAEDASPRVQTVFGDVRRRILPIIIQQKYADAKASFDRKESATAANGFKQVLDLLADPDVAPAANQPPLSNVGALAADFRRLSEAAAAPPPPVAPPPSPPPPAPVAPLPPRVIERRIYGPEDAMVVPPATIRQALPPLGDVFAVRQGIVEVVVDESGAVETATMRSPVNPVYDRLVLAAAKSWRYKAATLDGKPVRFRKMVQIDLKSR